jgi:hypothetical protein
MKIQLNGIYSNAFHLTNNSVFSNLQPLVSCKQCYQTSHSLCIEGLVQLLSGDFFVKSSID